MPSPFELATAVELVPAASPAAPGTSHYRAAIPEGWQQGRGAFGGLVLGVLARAMLAGEEDSRRTLRSISGDVCGPVLPGEVNLEVLILRRGKNLTNVDARLTQSGEILARASSVLSTPRAPDLSPTAMPAPTFPDWRTVEPLTVRFPAGPTFAAHLEFRPLGPLPFSGGPASEAVITGFVRHAVAPMKLDAPSIIALLDAYWPTTFSTWTTPRPMGTICFTAELLCDPSSLDPALPLFHSARLMALREGFFVEFRELWSGDVLVAMNQQTFAVIK